MATVAVALWFVTAVACKVTLSWDVRPVGAV